MRTWLPRWDRDLIVGAFVGAAVSVLAALAVAWIAVALVVGSVVVGRWLAGVVS
jgi:hypothetical protein